MVDSIVAADKAVGIHFTLKLDDGEVVDSSEGREEMFYLHGHDNIVPGLEVELQGKAVGDRVEVSVAPEQGYGQRDERGVTDVPRSDFPDDVELERGLQLYFENEEGDAAPGWVVDFSDESVTVDLNHPLAGENLHFAVEICSVRDATQEELDHGHIHGPGGHEH